MLSGAASILHSFFSDQIFCQHQTLRFTPVWAQKLVNSTQLNGHKGCVNRLAWSEDGSLLASGSDDRQVLLWSYPDVDKSPLALQTDHAANIFGVQFMPCTNNRQVITGAMDDTVMLHHIERLPALGVRRVSGPPLPVPFQSTLYGCHKARVKGVEVEPNNPHVFWSAAEDGTVRQYDTRLPSNSQKAWESSNCLLSVKAVGPASANGSIELKGISLNKAHVHQMAVAAGDVYVRVYDRRMLSTGSPKDEHVRADPVLQMAPPHMCLINSNKRAGRAHTTCVNFGNRGDKLVATYHCDQAYAFDVSATGACTTAFPTFVSNALPESGCSSSDAVMEDAGPANPASKQAQGVLPRPVNAEAIQKAEELKNEGNHAFFSRDVAKAGSFYSQALSLNPTSPMLHTNRAAALISREWVGDAMWALKDCEAALRLDPNLAKAHYRRIQALKAMNQVQAAYTAIQAFQKRFPLAGEDAARMKEDVYALLEERQQHAQQRKLRLMQKKRDRQGAQARRQAPADSEIAVLATGQQAQGQQSSPPAAPMRRHARAEPALPSLNIHRSTSPSARHSPATPPAATSPSAMSTPHRSASAVSPPARQLPALAEPPSGSPSLPHAVRSQHAPSSDATAHEDANEAVSQEGRQSQASLHRALSSHPSGTGSVDTAERPNPLPGDSFAHGFTMQQGSLQQPEGMTQQPAPMPTHDSGASEHEEGHTPRLAVEALGSELGAEHEGSGPEQESDSAMQDEEDRVGELGLPSGGPGLGIESDFFHEPSSVADADVSTGEMELPEEGWMCEEVDVHGTSGSRQGVLDGSETWAQGVGGPRITQRYVGHANVQTDIKEATFMGSHDDLVAAGSDDGSVYIYEAATGQVVRILQADEDVANCVQCHPTLPVLATSGIEHSIKLWSPDGAATAVDPANCALRTRKNQERIMTGPQVLRSISPRVFQALHDNPELLTLLQRGLASRPGEPEQMDEDDAVPGDINCRVN